MFGWWKAAKRRRIIAAAQPADAATILEESLWQWEFLPAQQRSSLLDWVRIFLAEKHWEGCNGLTLQNKHRVVIAGQAALMMSAYPEWYFDNVQSLLVYPEVYVAEGVTGVIGGTIGMHGQSARLGEAHYRGPVIINWQDVRRAARGPNYGHSITVHELAHQIDFVNGRDSDGIPPLPATVNADQWAARFQEQLQQMRTDVEEGYDVLIDDYGLQSESELFAVAGEAFFQIPHHLAHYHPELFVLLLDFYQCDWRSWIPKPDDL
ncbi:MAG: M90 family metallopeptidase [Pirellulales bacterium]